MGASFLMTKMIKKLPKKVEDTKVTCEGLHIDLLKEFSSVKTDLIWLKLIASAILLKELAQWLVK